MTAEEKELIPYRSLDELRIHYEDELQIEAVLTQAKKDAEDEKYQAECESFRPFILDALFEETKVSLADLNDALKRVDFTLYRGKVSADEIEYPQQVRATMTFYGVDVDADFKLVEQDGQILYNRSGAYGTSKKSYYDQPKITAHNFPELLHKCRKAQKQNEQWQQQQAEREAKEEREYQERLAQQQVEKDEIAALVDSIKGDRTVVRLLQALVEHGQTLDYFEQELYQAADNWDRCAESSANSLGDLQRDLEHAESALYREQQRVRELEWDLDEEKRKREREERGW